MGIPARTFRIPQICAVSCRFSSPDGRHNQTDPLPGPISAPLWPQNPNHWLAITRLGCELSVGAWYDLIGSAGMCCRLPSDSPRMRFMRGFSFHDAGFSLSRKNLVIRPIAGTACAKSKPQKLFVGQGQRVVEVAQGKTTMRIVLILYQISAIVTR
jgi:hypothetical protein